MRSRITANFNDTWQYTINQSATYMVPVLLSVLYMQRALTFTYQPAQQFDFSSTIAKLGEEGYDLVGDREELSSVFGEIMNKGVLSGEYQLSLLSFMMLWYFFASFLVQAFALLYYRKFRDS